MAAHQDSPAKLDNLVRSLNLLPYFQAHPDRTIMEAAKDLGREPGEILADLHRLTCTGVGSWPEELVDLTADYRAVMINNSQGMDRALRLTPTEAGALLLTLESLEAMPGLTDREAVLSAAAKLRGILAPKAVAVYDSLATDDPAETQPQELMRRALDTGRRVRFTYYSASADTSTVRTVDPVRIFVNAGETYLTAWEESSGRHKHYRADRMSHVDVLDEAAAPHLDQMPFDAHDPFGFRAVEEKAVLAVEPDATWLADYYPLTLGEELVDGRVEATMPVGSREWFIRFVLGQSDRLAVIGPESLVAAVHQRALVGLGAYDGTSD
ncbi:hypothetical protein CATRI_06525 [Corynebacterium atrinae]|uniref:helix-turn-helix transcriptional regulator n=1 Tax=Corynebacterium atrinae TaxID=1336740 RepID=UPI0025B584B3|nr:WYL domain-containing protein [Corynebacterium atrinae]WJY63387.1 hypothetical protein CATRI_06525 [Corynebacterium atrinae]